MVNVAAEVPGTVRIQIVSTTNVEFSRTSYVAVAKMVQTNGDLNQPLIEFAGRPAIIGPQFLPHVVGFIEFAVIKIFHSLEIPRLIFNRLHHIHRSSFNFMVRRFCSQCTVHYTLAEG